MPRKRNKQRERERERERVLAWMVRTFVHAYSSVVSGFFEDFVLLHTLSLLCSDPLAYASYEITSFVNWTAWEWDDGQSSCSVDPRWEGKCEHRVSSLPGRSRACFPFQCVFSKFISAQHDHVYLFTSWWLSDRGIKFYVCSNAILRLSSRQISKTTPV
jgi:hypothetical protein